MSMWQAILVGAGVTLLIYVLFVVWLIVAGRREAARAVAGFVPDCVVLFHRLLGDPRVPRRKKLVLAAIVPYLALPFDVVPDFIPVAGYLDDAVIVAFVLRYVLRGSGSELIESHWPGPRESLGLILRLAGYERGSTLVGPSPSKMKAAPELERLGAALLVDGLTKVYTDGPKALDRLELRVPGGSFFGLRGQRLARVDIHSHADLRAPRPGMARERGLGIHRCRDRTARVGEGDEEAVALRVHLDAVVAPERVPQEPPVVSETPA